jgi:hypothetical protein
VPEGDPLPGAAGYTTADVVRACEDGMALNLDDALSRRLRLGFLDAAATWAAGPAAARVMAEHLGWPGPVVERQLARLARHLETDFGHRREEPLDRGPQATQGALEVGSLRRDDGGAEAT